MEYATNDGLASKPSSVGFNSFTDLASTLEHSFGGNQRHHMKPLWRTGQGETNPQSKHGRQIIGTEICPL